MADALPVVAEKAKEVVSMINPEWVNAPYELAIVDKGTKYQDHLFNRFIHFRRPEAIDDPYPMRYKLIDPLVPAGEDFSKQWEEVPPFIWVERDSV